MNKTYKVRATRAGALQVVSELTSSVAAIGTKIGRASCRERV